MAPRANWKGFLRLSLVTCPVALYPATSDTEKVSFNQINRKTGHRIKYAKVDAETGEEVSSEDIMKGYKVDTDTYIEVTKEELDDIALDSTRTIEIDEFVPRSEIDSRYLIRPYYLVPDGKVGHDAFAVIRETTDGFRIAEVDLEMRGAGDVIGTAQSGLPRFRIADLEHQAGLMAVARQDARNLLEQDPGLGSPRGQAVRMLMWLMSQDEAIRLIAVG